MINDSLQNININSDLKSKIINTEKWNEELSLLRINRRDMNKIVLNYLIIEGYKDAVEKFILETGIEGKEKFIQQITIRIYLINEQRSETTLFLGK